MKNLPPPPRLGIQSTLIALLFCIPLTLAGQNLEFWVGGVSVAQSSAAGICTAHQDFYTKQAGVSIWFCQDPTITACETDPKLFYQSYANAGLGPVIKVQRLDSNAGLYNNTTIRMGTRGQYDACAVPIAVSSVIHGGKALCEDWQSRAAWDAYSISGKAYFSSLLPTGKCQCLPEKNIYNEPDPLTWDGNKKLCVGCSLLPPVPLETLITQYDITEEAKACTRRLEAGGNCDNLVKPALLTAKACLQTKMAEVGFAWNGSTTSLFRTRGYQAHFWDLFQKRWTKSGLAKLATDDPTAYKSCTPPPHGVHKNHGLMDTVANPDSVQPHHTTGSAFDVSNDIIRDYKSALKVWAGKHQKDANYKERTITNEAVACGLRWGGNFNDDPHFDLGR
jgi:hypothetical protein